MGEQVLLYSAAAILSACVAAMGFKIADKSKGGISITKMVADLAKSAVPGFKVILGTAAMGLNPGLFYAYMQVVNGKTSVPQNLISWIQDWLNKNSVYDGPPVIENLYTVEQLRKQNITGNFEYKPMSVEEVVVALKPYILARFNGNETTYNKFLESAKAATQYKGLLICFNSTSSGSIEFDIYEETEPINCNFTPTATPWIRISYTKQHKYTSTSGSFSESHFVGQTNYFTYLSSYNYTSINATVSSGNDTGIEAGENVPGKDVVIPGEGTGNVTNEDIVGWLQSAVGAAVASALGIGTASIPFVPVTIKNPAITGDITDALENVIDQVQNISQAGATDIDNIATGEKYANTSLAPSKPSGNISASSLYTIWNPTQAQLNNLANFLWSTDFVNTIKKILQSPMDALISLALFPVTPPTDGTHNISLGYIDSGVAARRVSDQFMTVQTSGLVVPHKYNSYLDYAPYTKAEIFLPFIGFCPLNINDIMGKSVDVTYNIDLLSGVCTAIVHANAHSLYSYSGNMAMFLPLSAGNWARMLTPIFGMVGGVTSLAAGIGGVMGGAPLLASTSMAVRGAESIGNMDGNSVSRSGGISGNAGIMGDYQPFIVVTRPINDKPTTYDSNIGQTYNKSAQLGTLSGFTIIEEAHIEGMNATDAEKQEIEQLLKEGVIL
jgi:hypothetical protein